MISSRDEISRVNTLLLSFFSIDTNLEDVYTWHFLRDETCPGMKSSLSMVKCLLLFTRFCRYEISSQDELIPVKKAGMKFHPWMKNKEKKMWCEHFIPGWNFKMSMFFFNFWRMHSNMLSKVTCLNVMRVWM